MTHDEAPPTVPEPDNTDTTLSPDVLARALKSTRRHPFRAGVILGSVITVAVVLLIIQNGATVRLDWLAFHFRTPLWIMLLSTAAAGAVVWELAKAAARRARRLRRDQRQALQAAQTTHDTPDEHDADPP